MKRELQPIVCVCVYNRVNSIQKWIRAWNNADKCGAKLVVIHNFDVGPRGFPDVEQTQEIINLKPDFYIPRVNLGFDIGALQEFLYRRNEFPFWDVFFWFSDDVIPMKKDFLHPFMEKISTPNVGLVGSFFEQLPRPHMRTTGFGLKREVAMRLSFPPHLFKSPEERYAFEHGSQNMYRQVVSMGYKVELSYGSFEQEWCSDQSLVWDTDHCFNHGLWPQYELQFD